MCVCVCVTSKASVKFHLNSLALLRSAAHKDKVLEKLDTCRCWSCPNVRSVEDVTKAVRTALSSKQVVYNSIRVMDPRIITCFWCFKYFRVFNNFIIYNSAIPNTCLDQGVSGTIGQHWLDFLWRLGRSLHAEGATFHRGALGPVSRIPSGAWNPRVITIK